MDDHENDDHKIGDQEAGRQSVSSRAFSEEVDIPDPRGGDASLEQNANAIRRLVEARRTDLSAVEDLWSRVKTHVEENTDELSEHIIENIIEALADEYEHQARTASESGEWERFEGSVLFSSLEDLQEAVDETPYGSLLPDRTPDDLADDPPEKLEGLAEMYFRGNSDDEDEIARQWGDQVAMAITHQVSSAVDRRFLGEGRDPSDVSDAEWEASFRGYLKDDFELEEFAQKLLERGAVELVNVLKWTGEEQELTPLQIEQFLGLEKEDGDTSSRRKKTPELDPDPFQGAGETAGLLGGPLSYATAQALLETPEEKSSEDSPTGSYQEEWGSDGTGHPIRVEELSGQYSGRVTFRIQAYGEPNPAAFEAEMGWALLRKMEMEEVWLHALLLAYASAPARRGERKVIRIPRSKIERLAMGFRSRNRSKWERAKKIKKHIDRLRSVFVQFQNVERHGDKLRFRQDMNATPLWNLRMVAEGEKDLFTGEEWSEWYLEAREGMWAEEFLHEHGEQWAPLPKEWFEQIDRRGSDWGQRLALLLLFLFRINREDGGRVELSAAKMLRACGVDLTAERNSRDRFDLKKKLSSTLDDLRLNYGMRVHDEDVNVSKIDDRIRWTTWKNQTATIDPPEKIDQRLFSGSAPKRPPLPKPRPGRWSKKQIERLLGELGWPQKKLAKELPVNEQSVSHYLNGRRHPSDDVRKALDRIEARYLKSDQ